MLDVQRKRENIPQCMDAINDLRKVLLLIQVSELKNEALHDNLNQYVLK